MGKVSDRRPNWGKKEWIEFAELQTAEVERLTTENRALRSAFASLRDRLTEVSVQAEDAVIAINMDSASEGQD